MTADIVKADAVKAFMLRTALLAACLLAGTASTAIAQSPSPTQASSQPQLQTLQTITQSLQLGQHPQEQQGQFVQRKYLSILPQPLVSRGHYAFQQDTGLEWQVLQPLPSKLTFSAAGIQQEQNGQQVWLARADQPGIAAIGQIMAAIFTSDWHTLQEFFRIEVLPPAAPSASGTADNSPITPNSWSLKLTPTQVSLQQAMSHILLSGDHQLRHMTLFEPNNDRTEIDFQ
ncbi:outer membrane lipoprotein carrier protein LolA [Aestuariicella hydrocarbonica]|uniref:Outer membrane lipoprotein carrier protein LolA n=1 Tax=Pseudomaricurvus hydrocarbonicus TaxID=1470433 RepID=A0A9E5JU27_9GAMM|nr:outer membrane lipoprotein carrier protein LolA [Aestuariicella hydrocarbonica]NHO64900.1 outer membrane lipoprotein carrier protein LolA [Aestuariicella hydrocarbonica]